MVDVSYSRQKQQEDHATVQVRRRRLIAPLVAAFVLIGAAWTMVWTFDGSKVVAPSPEVTTASATTSSDELVETTKGLVGNSATDRRPIASRSRPARRPADRN